MNDNPQNKRILVDTDSVQTLTRKVLRVPIIDDFTLGQHDHSNAVSGGSIKLAYGSFWGNEIGWSQAAAVQNTWYTISDADIDTGSISEVSHNGSGLLTVTPAGAYVVNWAWSGGCTTSGSHVQIGLYVDSTIVSAGMNHMETSKANDHMACAGTAILSLSGGNTIALAMRTTDAGGPTLDTDHINVTVAMIARG